MAEDINQEVKFETTCTNIACHPTDSSLSALGFVDGVVKVVDHASGLKDRIQMKNAQNSLTCLAFTQGGNSLASGSGREKTLKICSFETGKILTERDEFEHGLQSIFSYDENLVAISDCDKTFEVLDLRQSLTKSILKNSDHVDYISGFLGQPEKHRLFSLGSAGQLGVWDMRKNNLWAASEEVDDEFLCGIILNHGRRVLVGCESSQIRVYKTDQYKRPCHCIPGHADSVNRIVKYDEDTIITACGDGYIRMIACEPTKMLGILGSHGDFPVEDISLSHDKRWLLSCSFDDIVKIWDLEAGENPQSKEEPEQKDDSESDSDERPKKKRKKRGNTLSFSVDKKKENLQDFFADL